jgi:hypothetical protein
MIFDYKKFEDIDESDLRGLNVSEGKSIDYKRNLPGMSDSKKMEFLADVSSFANAIGGYLVYGIVEKEGIPVDICGLENINVDEVKQWFENIIRDGIKPRITGILIKEVQLKESGKYVIVIKIPKSWALPHMITYKNHSKFYARNSSGKYQLDVQEIRNLFILSETIVEKIKNFRIERISKIVSGDTPVIISDGPKLVLHILPIISFEISSNYDISSIELEIRNIITISGSSTFHRYNIDGFVNIWQNHDLPFAFSYTQFFRNGIIEAVDSLLFGRNTSENYIPSVAIETRLIEILERCITTIKRINIEPPLIVMLSLLNVYDLEFKASRYSLRYEDKRPFSIDRNELIIPEILIDDYDIDIAKKMKPIFDAIWNSAGFPRSMNYDKNGNWNPK